MDIKQIIDRCKKLSRLSESSNEHEAAAAAEQLSRLMLDYEIDEAQLAVEDGEDKEPIVEHSAYENTGYIPKKQVTWKLNLAAGLSRSVGAYHYIRKGDVRIFGRRSQVTKVQYLLQYLANEVNRLAEEAWAEIKHTHWETARAFKTGFRYGASVEIRQRLENQRAEYMEQRKLEAQEEGDDSTCQALVRIRDADAEVDTAYKKKSKGFKAWRSSGVRSSSGFKRGKEAGSRVSLGGSGAALPAATPRLRNS